MTSSSRQTFHTSLFVLSAYSSFVLAAPAPVYKERSSSAPACVKAGMYKMFWAVPDGSTTDGMDSWQVTLGKDGSYTAVLGSSRWYGSWGWCPKSRLFALHETCSNGNHQPGDIVRWSQYVIRLDGSLSGRTEPEPGAGEGPFPPRGFRVIFVPDRPVINKNKKE